MAMRRKNEEETTRNDDQKSRSNRIIQIDRSKVDQT